MSDTYRVVRLLKNHLYPTYQLHAYMASGKTTPQNGLRLAALITMDWLRRRLGDDAPGEFACLPDPSSYRDIEDQDLPSLHINEGYLIDIVSLPEQGVWTLQITEPDLGSHPGDPEQTRPAVPGRVITTNVGFKVVGTRLECGFQTVISDPEGTAEPAEVYRLAIIRRLVEHPDFGLKQLTRLTEEPEYLSTMEQIKRLKTVWKDGGNQLPSVVFTCARPTPELPPEFSQGFPSAPLLTQRQPVIPTAPAPATPELPYDAAAFARSGVTFCRSYVVEDALFDRLTALLEVNAQPGDILLLEPPCFGGGVRIVPYKPSRQRRIETIARLREEILQYPRGKTIDFGPIQFLSEVREDLLHSTEDAQRQTAQVTAEWTEQLAQVEARHREELARRDREYEALKGQLERQKQYQAQLEGEKEALRQSHAEELAQLRQTLADKDEDIAYLQRKLSQPKEHAQIAQWVKENFAGRLILHPKAVALLEDRSTKTVSVELICDALDFLATDYWARRYAHISTEEMNSRCSEKYGRPFEIKPTGTTTVEFTPTEYKIKYFPGATGKPVESPLDYHLSVGNDPGNLLRIYFLHDDDKQLVVVGSLPKHLKAVTIK